MKNDEQEELENKVIDLEEWRRARQKNAGYKTVMHTCRIFYFPKKYEPAEEFLDGQTVYLSDGTFNEYQPTARVT